jgi:hypothetical protein
MRIHASPRGPPRARLPSRPGATLDPPPESATLRPPSGYGIGGSMGNRLLCCSEWRGGSVFRRVCLYSQNVIRDRQPASRAHYRHVRGTRYVPRGRVLRFTCPQCLDHLPKHSLQLQMSYGALSSCRTSAAWRGVASSPLSILDLPLVSGRR